MPPPSTGISVSIPVINAIGFHIFWLILFGLVVLSQLFAAACLHRSFLVQSNSSSQSQRVELSLSPVSRNGGELEQGGASDGEQEDKGQF